MLTFLNDRLQAAQPYERRSFSWAGGADFFSLLPGSRAFSCPHAGPVFFRFVA